MNKKSLFLLFLLALLGRGVQGQGVVPYVIEENLQPARTGVVLYRSVEAAWAGKPEGAENFSKQDGTWAMKVVQGEPAQSDLGQGLSLEGWKQVELPSAWQWAGVGEAVYAETAYPFLTQKPKFGALPRVNNPRTVLYARDVTVPFDYMDKQLYLRVGGFGGGRLTLYVNGQWAGSATDSRSESEWDVTWAIKRGQNRVVVAVEQVSEASWVEDQTGWRLGGVNRSIWLVAQPKIRVRDYVVRTTLDPTYTNGLLETGLLLKSELLNPHTVTVYYDLYDRHGKLVNQAFREVSLDMRAEDTVRFTASIPGVDKWTAETPSLYTVVFRVKREGRWTEVLARKVGFRTVETKNKQLLINGVAPQIRGVNIEEFDATTGNVLDPKKVEAELTRIKQAGFNALRTGGYPLPGFFYEQADSLGFYVWSVANACSAGLPRTTQKGGTLANNPAWREVFVDRAVANYETTKNYPSVVAVALGEAAGNGYGMYHAYRAIKARDPERVVVYDGANAEWNTDVVCPLYPTVGQLQAAAKRKIEQPIIASRVVYDPACWNIEGVQGAFVDRWANPSLNRTGGDLVQLSNDYARKSAANGRIEASSAQDQLASIAERWAPITWEPAGKANLYRVGSRLQYANLSYYPVWVRVKPLVGKEQWVQAAPIDCPPMGQIEYTLNVTGKPLEIKIGNLFQTTL